MLRSVTLKLVRLLILPTTFVLGVFGAFQFSHIDPLRVSLCDLANHPSLYHRRTVSLEIGGYYQLQDDMFLISDVACQNPNAEATVIFDHGAVNEFGDLERSRPDVLLSIIGEFDSMATPGCFAPKFALKSAKVRAAIVKSRTSEPNP